MSFLRLIHGKRFAVPSALIMGVIDALGIAAGLGKPGSTLVAFIAFGLTAVVVFWMVTALQNEIDERDELLNARDERRRLRDHLDHEFFRKYKALSETGDVVATDRLDAKLKALCETTPELSGYWSVFSSGANLGDKTPPDTVTTDAQKRTWFRVQTRTLMISKVISDHLKDCP
jgi:hypothetical protein